MERIVKFLAERGFKDLKEVNKKNVFRLFNIEQKFAINTANLQREMHRIQRQLHPDKFVNTEPREMFKSEELSMFVNQYYRVLANPYERGKFLLGLMRDKSEAEIEGQLDQLQMDGAFLARMMELRETIDSTNDSIKLSNLSQSLEKELAATISEINKDFESKNLDALPQKLGKLKFLVNCSNALNNKNSNSYTNNRYF